MEKRQFGKTDMQVSVLGFGGAEIGFEKASVDHVRELLAAALDQGLNVIDTAECYEGSEALIGDAVGSRRKDFYLFTKCGHGKSYMDDAWGVDDIEASIERSLKRLKTDYVDLLQLHSCTEELLREGDVIDVLQRIKKEGKARYIGYSGDGGAAVYAIKCGAFDALQTSVNIVDQEAITLTLPLAASNKIGVIAKRPVANAAWRHKTKPENPYIHPYWDRLQKLHYDFVNGDINKSAEMALRFTLSIPEVSTMIVGTTKAGRWKENAETIAKGTLSKDEFQQIRRTWESVAEENWVGQA